jgi:hypothetical protein
MSKDYLVQLTQRLTQIEKLDVNTRNQSRSIKKSIHEGSTWIDINKDLVVNGYHVISTCDPNKILATNEHKQLSSVDLLNWINGTDKQIYVNNNDGKISLNCPQNIDKTSSPEFNSVKIFSDPKNDNDVTSKKYVDNLLKTIEPLPLNTCSRVDIVNPTGDCLRIGRNEGTFVDINIDSDGTLNLTNEKPTGVTNDIDIYGQRINLLSNINSSSPNSGSLVVFGGVGIIKDLHVGGELILRTENGIPTNLNYFEEGTLTMMWEGIWDDPIDTSILYQRIGNWVTLMIPYTANRAIKSDKIQCSDETVLPERLRPIYDIKITTDGIDNNSEILIQSIVYGDSGKIMIYPKSTKKYYGEGISGFGTFCIQFMVDPKRQP